MPAEQKYPRIEWERRFLLDRFPREAIVTRVRAISDRYIEGTTLRLRQQSDSDGPTVFKLTQKLGDKANGAGQGLSRFTGGHLVTVSRQELENGLAQHGIKLNSSHGRGALSERVTGKPELTHFDERRAIRTSAVSRWVIPT
jgi:hypothetical protein